MSWNKTYERYARKSKVEFAGIPLIPETLEGDEIFNESLVTDLSNNRDAIGKASSAVDIVTVSENPSKVATDAVTKQ